MNDWAGWDGKLSSYNLSCGERIVAADVVYTVSVLEETGGVPQKTREESLDRKPYHRYKIKARTLEAIVQGSC